MNALKVRVGDKVKVSYIGMLEDGKIFDTSYEDVAKEAGIFYPERSYEPIEFVVGSGEVIAGLDEAVVGMELGEEKEVKIPPEKAYGHVREDLIQRIPIEIFRDSGIDPKEGSYVSTSYGIARISKVMEDEVELDFNHPLAGKNLVFRIKIEEIIKEKE